MHLFILVFLLFPLSAGYAADWTPINGSKAVVYDYQREAETRGRLLLRCTNGAELNRKIGAPPKIEFVEAREGEGLLIARFLESRRVAWSLNRALLIPVRGCSFGEPYPVVEEDSFVYSTPVDEPDVMKMNRQIFLEPSDDGLSLRIETQSDKIFLDPDGGRPYAHFRRLWPDEYLSLDLAALKVIKVSKDFEENTARWRLYDSGVQARDGWFRVDTPQSRSQDALTR